ncbi:MAG: hypothetical protein ACXW4Z_10450 [Candidatus Binatia bacterium]
MEKRKSVDQRQKVDQFFEVHSAQLARQGTIVAGFRERRGRRLGPYYRLSCRVGGRQLAVYLGGEGPVLDETRQRLDRLQAERRRQQRWQEMRRTIHRETRAARRRLAEELANHGLMAKGSEIRGWRHLG